MNENSSFGYRLEQAAFHAWSPAQTLIHQGWVIRLDSGYTGRANSVTPQGVAIPPFDAQVDYCESLYHERGLPPIFRLTSLDDYSELEVFLGERGYAHTSDTLVMTAPCKGQSSPYSVPLPLDEWLPHYNAHSDKIDTGAHRTILERIQTPHLYAALQVAGEIVAVGLGVVEADLFGLFDIVVAHPERGKGYGKGLVQSMMAWGAEQGATTAYLQVTGQNTIAQRLYRQLGFTDAYYYHYRRQS